MPWQTAVQDWSRARSAVEGWPDDYDVIWFGALDHAVSLEGLRTRRRTVVDCDDVETVKLRALLRTRRRAGESRLDRWQRRVELPLWGRLQRFAATQAQAVLVCSDLDRERLSAQSGAPTERILVVPNTYGRSPGPVERSDDDRRCTVLLVANYGTDQNVDAAAFAVQEVLPRLRRRVPTAELRLVGRDVERIAGLLPADGLTVVGPVDEVAPELARATVVLVPMRYGGGTRLKILEAFAHGTPVVSTSAGAEGLDAVHDEHLLLGDTADALAAAVERLVNEPETGRRLAAAGERLWLDRFSPDAGLRAVDRVLEQVLGHDLRG